MICFNFWGGNSEERIIYATRCVCKASRVKPVKVLSVFTLKKTPLQNFETVLLVEFLDFSIPSLKWCACWVGRRASSRLPEHLLCFNPFPDVFFLRKCVFVRGSRLSPEFLRNRVEVSFRWDTCCDKHYASR